MDHIFPIQEKYKGLVNKYYENLQVVFKTTSRIKFTCVCVSESYVALGTNIGSVYLLWRSDWKYFTHFVADEAHAIQLITFSPNGSYLGCVPSNGIVLIYAVKSSRSGKVECLRKCLHHRDSVVSCIQWDFHSSILYSGDIKGVVSASHVPLPGAKDLFAVANEPILRLESEIVQLDCYLHYVLVSTTEKCVVCNTETRQFHPVGSKARVGQYGGCFWPVEESGNCKVKILSARPGHRIWVASTEGVVEQTQQYKEVTRVRRWDLNDMTKSLAPGETSQETLNGQFSYLFMLKCGLVGAINKGNWLFIIDPVRNELLTCLKLSSITLHFNLFDDSLMVIDGEHSLYSLTVLSTWMAISRLIEKKLFSEAIPLILENKSDLEEGVLEAGMCLSPDVMNDLISAPCIEEHHIDELKALKALPKTATLQVREATFERLPSGMYSRGNGSNGGSNIDQESAILSPVTITELNGTEKNKAMDSGLDTISLESSDFDVSPKGNDAPSPRKSSAARSLKTLTGKFDKLKQQLQLPKRNREFLKRLKERTTSVFSFDIETLLSSGESGQDTPTGDYSSRRTSEEQSAPKQVNFMELEAAVFITWEKLKKSVHSQLTSDQSPEMQSFIELVNKLTMRNWNNNFEFYLRRLILSTTEVDGVDTLSLETESLEDSTDSEALFKFLSLSSWTQTLNPPKWREDLRVPPKIAKMSSLLMTVCFEHFIFGENYHDMEEFYVEQNVLEACLVEDHDDEKRSVACQTGLVSTGDTFEAPRSTKCKVGQMVTSLLSSADLWGKQDEDTYRRIRQFVLYYGKFFDKDHLRNWLRNSCLSHELWDVIFSCLTSHVEFPLLSKLDGKNDSEVLMTLQSSLSVDSLENLVIIDRMLSKCGSDMNEFFALHLEEISLRDVMHIYFRHGLLDHFPAYVEAVRAQILSADPSTKDKFYRELCLNLDVLLCTFITALFSRPDFMTERSRVMCSCDYPRSRPEATKGPRSLLLRDMLSWIRTSSLREDPVALDTLMVTFKLLGYVDGFVELLVMCNKPSELIKLSVQLADESVLNKVKECGPSSKEDLVVLFDLKRRQSQTPISCLECSTQLPRHCLAVSQPLSWNEISSFLLQNISLDAALKLLLTLTPAELNCLASFIEGLFQCPPTNTAVDMAGNISSDSLLGHVNILLLFIERESVLKSGRKGDGGEEELTEELLDFFIADHSKILASDWGRVLRESTLCTLCGCPLKLGLPNAQVTGFPCGHLFHDVCLHPASYCIMCDFL